MAKKHVVTDIHCRPISYYNNQNLTEITTPTLTIKGSTLHFHESHYNPKKVAMRANKFQTLFRMTPTSGALINTKSPSFLRTLPEP